MNRENNGMKKSRMIIAGLAALTAASMIGGTWAAWTQTLWAKNEFKTAMYSTFLEENFESPTEWQPGIREQKEVWVRNDSTIPIIAKISINQSWLRREDITAWVQEEEGAEPVEKTVAVKYDPNKSPANNDPTSMPSLKFMGENGQEQFAAILNFNQKKEGDEKAPVVVLETNRNPMEGLRLNIPSVKTMKEAEGSWLLVSETPDELGNYTFYYMGLVQPGESTPVLLSSVTMNPLLESTITGSESYYVKDENAEGGYRLITREVVNSKYGESGAYDGCTYELNVNMHTVQATQAAVENVFTADSFREYIIENIADPGVYGRELAGPAPRLYFEESNGVMSYVPYGTAQGDNEQGNWFMSFVNMVPGGQYEDELIIENGSNKNYHLFMKIVPRGRTAEWDQNEIRNELLKRISMKVYYGDYETPIYDGDATGYYYSLANGNINMQGNGSDEEAEGGAVPLGYYSKGRQEKIKVVLTLDPTIGLEEDGSYRYADVLTKIDWKFMVKEYVENPPDDGPGGNRPGGNTPGGGGPRRDRTPGGNPPGTTTPIGDAPVPLGENDNPADENVIISDEGVPLTSIPDENVPLIGLIPKTGDDFPMIPVAVTAAVSLFLIILLGTMRVLDRKKMNK